MFADRPTVSRQWPPCRRVGASLTPDEIANLRPQFEAELAFGEGYQRAYQEYEEQRLAAGVPIADEHFFDAFHAGREPIASAVGPEEEFSWVPRGKISQYEQRRGWAWGILIAGINAIVAAALLRWWSGRARRRPERRPVPPDPG